MAQHQIALVETAQPSAEREITAAYQGMVKGEKLCLEFGRVCNAPATAMELRAELQAAWDAYRDAEPTAKGLTLGRLCYELRKCAEVVQGGTSFRATLAEIGIPKSTAYYWVERYEVLIGIRQPEDTDDTDDTNATAEDEDIPLLQDAKAPRLKIATVREGMRLRWNGRTLKVGEIKSHGDRLLIYGEWL